MAGKGNLARESGGKVIANKNQLSPNPCCFAPMQTRRSPTIAPSITERKTGIVIADASGHGMGAALLVFFLLRAIPGDVCEVRLAGTGLYADPAEIDLILAEGAARP